MKLKYKLLYTVSAMVSAVLLFVGRENVVKYFAGVSQYKIALPIIQAEFLKIKIHEGDKWISPPVSFGKNSIVGVKGYLRSTSSVDEILDFYKSNLIQTGWDQVDSRNRNGEESVKFCKKGMSFIIVSSSGRDGVEYYMGIVWTNFRRLESYCPQLKN